MLQGQEKNGIVTNTLKARQDRIGSVCSRVLAQIALLISVSCDSDLLIICRLSDFIMLQMANLYSLC